MVVDEKLESLREASADSDYKEDLVAEKITQNREELAGLEEAMRKAVHRSELR